MANIAIKINVEQISKGKLFKGEKGTYLNAVLIETPNSQHSEYMIVEESTKEERDAGTKSKIIGNGKIIKPKQEQESRPMTKEESDNLPF